eukprot:TRINITY_DN68181_c0_g1_i1.p1 TRINITY_DN68181_c0_g1~~TRINITY_DN68181_c0_g1_i1.p1  ORF type:complete len:235 (-),score=53.24 TRINITY_DN68181_c0_g1_i1:44-685(-)
MAPVESEMDAEMEPATGDGTVGDAKLPQVEPSLQPGDRVMFKDLTGAKHLNGITGRILNFDAASGRYVVQSVKDNSKKLFKPANLQVLIADEAELRSIFESDAATTKKLRSLVSSGELGFAEFSDSSLRSMLRRLLDAGYWAEQPVLMDELVADLALAEYPGAEEAMKLIKELETTDDVSPTLSKIGKQVRADPALLEVFNELRARGHDFDFH